MAILGALWVGGGDGWVVCRMLLHRFVKGRFVIMCTCIGARSAHTQLQRFIKNKYKYHMQVNLESSTKLIYLLIKMSALQLWQ